jgi:protein O-mannosyl-transferase
METKDEGRILPVYIMVGILVLVVLAYYPVFSSDFLNYDDPSYVTSNEYVKAGITANSVKWAFTTFYFYNWHPLTWLSHMLDVQFFGLDPMWHHLTSLLFHVVNTLLLFLLFKKMTGAPWKSLCLAALFALHPLHVESVAWVADRKDVLSTFFWFLTMLVYLGYARRPSAVTYALCVLSFIFGLMAKPMVVTLPLILLLMDYWPLGRLHQGNGVNGVSPKMSLSYLVLEKIPLALLSLASVVVTYSAQEKGGALRAGSPTIVNLGHALFGYAKYAVKTIWPSKLAVYYPYDPTPPSPWQIAAVAAGIVIVSGLVLGVVKRLPYLATGWFWYLITLIPAIGFVGIGQHAMADRYTYIPLIGLFLLVIWGTGDLAERFRIPRSAVTVSMIAIIMTCLALTNLQTRRWHDSITLFTHALQVTENNSLAHKNLAEALANGGRLAEALHHASESLRIHPEPLEYVSQAWLYLQLGQYEKAVNACRNSTRMAPDNEKAHFLLGVSSVYLKNYETAVEEYRFLKRSNSRYSHQLLELLRRAGVSLSAD